MSYKTRIAITIISAALTIAMMVVSSQMPHEETIPFVTPVGATFLWPDFVAVIAGSVFFINLVGLIKDEI